MEGLGSLPPPFCHPLLLPLLSLSRNRQRSNRDLGGRLPCDLLPVTIGNSHRDLSQRNWAPVADDGREFRRAERHRADRIDNGVGRHHSRRAALDYRLVLVQS